MLSLNLYIHGAGSISPALDDQSGCLKKVASEPDYTAWIPPMQLRRTGKAVRMGIGAAKLCLASAGMERPDALSIGTAMGCLQDTEVFLNKMVSQDEKMLTPTAFIQSTHNTVGGQIALLTGCYGHNMTYVHRGHSFEHAIINTRLYLQDHPGERVLTGGIDELTNSSFLLMQRAGFYTNGIASAEIIAGEGAAFFAISENAEDALLKLNALHLFVAATLDHAAAEIGQWIASQCISPGDIGQVLTGENNDDEYERLYKRPLQQLKGVTHRSFKHQSGEFATASALALHEAVRYAQNAAPGNGRKILMINHYCDHYSCWLAEVGK